MEQLRPYTWNKNALQKRRKRDTVQEKEEECWKRW